MKKYYDYEFYCPRFGRFIGRVYTQRLPNPEHLYASASVTAADFDAWYRPLAEQDAREWAREEYKEMVEYIGPMTSSGADA